MTLDGKVAVVTGAGAGLGRAVALRLAADGASVVAVSLIQSELEELRGTATRDGLELTTVQADVGNAVRTHEVAEEVLALHERVDILVNNAGIIVVKPIDDTPPDEWDRVLSTNLRGAYLYTRAFLPPMKAKRDGVILNVSSASGARGFVNESAYCASKFGLEGLTAALALELEPWNIRVAAVSPGAPMNTPMSETTYDDDARTAWLDPAEIAPGFSVIAVAKAEWISGRRFDAHALSVHGLPADRGLAPRISSSHSSTEL